MTWTAIVPLKASGQRKGRLAACLSAAERDRLSANMFLHVVGILSRHPSVQTLVIVSPERPDGWSGAWYRDHGRGLNAELAAARAIIPEDVLVILADLPRLEAADIDALLDDAWTGGIAIAPDRHGSGTNALALRQGAEIEFRFGVGSFARHREQVAGCAIVRRAGLELDVDTPEDLDVFLRSSAS